jgi:hypothetical protein
VTDLLTRLQAAAPAALENERQGLTYDIGRLRTVTVELEVSLGGNVVVGGRVRPRCGKPRKGTAA